jgi:hypothetical protein
MSYAYVSLSSCIVTLRVICTIIGNLMSEIRSQRMVNSAHATDRIHTQPSSLLVFMLYLLA